VTAYSVRAGKLDYNPVLKKFSKALYTFTKVLIGNICFLEIIL
jgi:hypothetical protein